MADLTNANLRATLPAGITLDATLFPDAASALVPVSAFLRAVEEAQTAQNATAPAGEDVQVIAVAAGVEQTITRNGVTTRVTPVTRTVTVLEKRSVDTVFPVLV